MIKVFIHLVDFSEYIAQEIVGKISDSGIIDECELNIFCNYDKKKFEWLEKKLPTTDRIRLFYDTAQPMDFELPTLKYLKDSCDQYDQESYVLYLHHKGAMNPNNPCVDDWRRFMLHHTVTRWKDCVNVLDQGYDTAGVNLQMTPLMHYSGNFWWAKSGYIKRLPKIKLPKEAGYKTQFDIPRSGPEAYRFDAEFWLGLANPRAFSFKDSGVNHYHHRYTDYLDNQSMPAYYVKQ